MKFNSLKFYPFMQLFKNRILFISLFLFVFASCTKEKVVTPQSPSAERELVNVKISKAENPSYSDDGFMFKRNDKVYITLPAEADASKVKLTFEISPNANLTLDDKPVTNLSGTFDLSNTVKAVVTSASGNAKSFYILAQNGIKELDKLIYEFKENFDIPGVSYAISKTSESKIVYKSGIGFSDNVKMLRTKPNHLFRLGSISKQFTSLCIMKLIQNGKFSVDSKVFGPGGLLENQFPDYSAGSEKVTVRNLLDHTSGWPTDPDPMFSGGNFKGKTLDQLIQYVLTLPVKEPGTTFSYFNMGYGMLGKIIETVSGKKYEEYLKEVLAEANITDIHVGGDLSHKRPNEVVYYSQDGYNGYLNDMEVIAAAGGVIASTEEMLKLIPYIDGKSNVPDIITPEVRNLMLTNSNSPNYALGWRMNHRLFPGAWYHGGNLAGTATFWVMGPQYSTVILCNSRSYMTGFDDELYYISEKLIKASEGLF